MEFHISFDVRDRGLLRSISGRVFIEGKCVARGRYSCYHAHVVGSHPCTFVGVPFFLFCRLVIVHALDRS